MCINKSVVLHLYITQQKLITSQNIKECVQIKLSYYVILYYSCCLSLAWACLPTFHLASITYVNNTRSCINKEYSLTRWRHDTKNRYLFEKMWPQSYAKVVFSFFWNIITCYHSVIFFWRKQHSWNSSILFIDIFWRKQHSCSMTSFFFVSQWKLLSTFRLWNVDSVNVASTTFRWLRCALLHLLIV